ncbi:hypothetical protein ABZ743_21420 [Streptomyces sp. NPDC006662]|uniref:hypothetical protein n=1 Tax=Streptomyces sp. NPDC006662 TaxID=3156902 RepID=UPI0033ECBACF
MPPSDDTWWNPHTQRWEPAPDPSRQGEPDHPAPPQPPARPESPGEPEYYTPPQPPARPESPAQPEYFAPPTHPARPATPPEPARPEQPTGPEEEAARAAWPGRVAGSEEVTRVVPPAQRTGSEDGSRGEEPGQAGGLAWYERPGGPGWGPPAPEAGLPPLPPPHAWAPQSPPPPPPPPPQEPGGRAGQWRTPLLVGVAAAVIGGASVAAWMLLGGKDAAPATDARPPAHSATATTPQPTAPQPTAPSTSASGSPGNSPSAGYTVARNNQAGFSVAVPTGWGPSYDEQGSGAFYRPPGGDRSALLQVFRISEPASTSSCELLRTASEGLSRGTPAYQQLSVEPVAGSACELVYEYDSAESHGRRRGMERIITTPDGDRWALLAAGPSTDAVTTRANLTAALDSFRPE